MYEICWNNMAGKCVTLAMTDDLEEAKLACISYASMYQYNRCAVYHDGICVYSVTL